MVMRSFTAASVRSALVEKFRQAYLCVPRVRTELGENELSSTSLELEWESVHTGLTTPMAVAGKGFHLRLSLIFRTISKKSMQLGSPNLTQIYSTMSPGNPLIFGVKRSKVKVRSHKTLPAWVFALLWVLASSGCFQTTASPESSHLVAVRNITDTHPGPVYHTHLGQLSLLPAERRGMSTG